LKGRGWGEGGRGGEEGLPLPVRKTVRLVLIFNETAVLFMMFFFGFDLRCVQCTTVYTRIPVK
jgi:hypothetical protein